jgi:CRP-like cAMP-binding protein
MRDTDSRIAAAFEAVGDRRHFADGERLYDEDSDPDEVFLVRDGAVTLHRGGSAGTGDRIGEKRPGELVGESAALDRLRHTVSAQALGRATVDVLSAERFRKLLQDDARACYEVAVALARTLRAAGSPPV